MLQDNALGTRRRIVDRRKPRKLVVYSGPLRDVLRTMESLLKIYLTFNISFLCIHFVVKKIRSMN